MALCKPAQLRTDAPKSEKRLFDALRTLPDEWRVYANVMWQSIRLGKQGDGEIDFVLVHPRRGILVVEAKGAGVSIANGEWFSTNNEGRKGIKNPYEQVKINKYALIRFLNDLGLKVPVHHAVSFPDDSDAGQLGTYGPPEITWWRDDLRNMQATVDRTMRHWNPTCRLLGADMKRLDELLAPTSVFKRRLVDDVGDVREALLRLTQEQMRVFDAIQRNRRAIVMGGPGSGKTLLSIARARRLRGEGFKTLWTCYNELLAKWVGEQFKDDEVEARTFHSLCIREVRRANHPLPALIDDRFWTETAPVMLLDAAAANDTTFDAVIIDEGQDFSQAWIDALEVLVADTKDAPLYIFADSQQRLYRRAWTIRDCLELDLPINCRNSTPIAERVAAIFDDTTTSYGTVGPEPVFSEVSDARKILDRVEARVGQLIEQERLEPHQLTVLADDDSFCRKLRERYAGPYPFTEHGKAGVVVETIQRFKGLESDVVVVVLTKDLIDAEELRHLAYVGFSRARAFLLVIGDPRLKSGVNWVG